MQCFVGMDNVLFVGVDGRRFVDIHTGTVDTCWKLAKQAIPATSQTMAQL